MTPIEMTGWHILPPTILCGGLWLVMIGEILIREIKGKYWEKPDHSFEFTFGLLMCWLLIVFFEVVGHYLIRGLFKGIW